MRSPGKQRLTARTRVDWRLVCSLVAALTSLVAAAAPVPFLDASAAGAHAVNAGITLREAVERYAVEPAERPMGDPVDARSADAVKLYAAGRLAAASGSFDEAVALLEQAAATDPSDHLPLRALGQTLIDAGRPATGVATLRQAIDRGNREQRTLVRVGLDALRRGEFAYAAGLLAYAAERATPDGDATLAHLAWAGLGESLLALGHDRAAAESIARGLDLPSSFSSPATLIDELQRLYRKRGFLWVTAGDASSRAGAINQSADAYARAARFPPLERPLLRPRRVNAELKRQQPERAAAITLERWPAFDMLDAALLSHVVDAGGLDPAIVRDAIELRSALLGIDPDPNAVSLVAMAIATDGAAVAELTKLASAPESPHLLPVIFAERFRRLLHRGDAEQALDEAAGLAGIGAGVASAAAQAVIHAGLAPQLLGDVRDDHRGTLGLWTRVHLGLAPWPANAERSADPAVVAAYLAERQRFDDLVEYANASTRDDLQVFAAEALADAGFVDRALDLIDSVEASPTLAVRLDALAARLHARTGPAPDADRLAARVNEMRALRPRSPTLRVLAAQELAGVGLLHEADQALRGVLLLDADSTLAAKLLLDVARARIASGAPDAADDLIAWLDTQRTARPDSVNLARLAAGVRLALREMDEAVRIAADAREHSGSPEIARLLESTLLAAGRAEEATELRTRRLARTPKSIDETVELATDAALLTDLARSPLDVLGEIPSESRLTVRQSERVGSAIVSRAASLQTLPASATTERESQRHALLGFIGWAVARDVELSPPMHERRLVLLAEAGASPDQIYSAAEDLAAQHPPVAVAAFRRATGLLTATGRGDEIEPALAEFSGLAREQRLLRPNAAAELVRHVVISGTIEDARSLIEQADRAGAVEEVTEAAFGPGDPDRRSGPAGLAYAMSGLAHAVDRGDLSDHLLRLTLEHDADHAWAANDLGYRLLVRDGATPEAAALIERAATSLPREASILDSLGWLRYTQGRLTDDHADPGSILERGAISLLSDAADLAGERDPGTIRAHLGDALFAAGDTDAARDAWQAAASQAEAAAAQLAGIQPPSRFARNIQDLIRALQARLAALDDGTDPLATKLPE